MSGDFDRRTDFAARLRRLESRRSVRHYYKRRAAVLGVIGRDFIVCEAKYLQQNTLKMEEI